MSRLSSSYFGARRLPKGGKKERPGGRVWNQGILGGQVWNLHANIVLLFLRGRSSRTKEEEEEEEEEEEAAMASAASKKAFSSIFSLIPANIRPQTADLSAGVLWGATLGVGALWLVQVPLPYLLHQSIFRVSFYLVFLPFFLIIIIMVEFCVLLLLL